jgi:hypothetical protein
MADGRLDFVTRRSSYSWPEKRQGPSMALPAAASREESTGRLTSPTIRLR